MPTEVAAREQARIFCGTDRDDQDALFDAYQPVDDFLTEADIGALRLVFPTVAIAEANTQLKASENAWTPILLSRVECLSLTLEIAITIGPWPGDLAARHVIYETRAVEGRVVTMEPDRYRGWRVPVIIV